MESLNAQSPQPESTPQPRNVRASRYPTNPVEIGIFSILSLVFVSSAYQLVYDPQGVELAALQPSPSDLVVAVNAGQSAGGGRSPASVATREPAAPATVPSFQSFSVTCNTTGLQGPTSAARITQTGAQFF